MTKQVGRREFVISSSALMALLVGCGQAALEHDNHLAAVELGREDAPPSGSTITMYDTYAMATYYDGTLGPKTGICKVSDVVANQPVTLRFWHGHGGKQHMFTITPEHFAMLRHNKKVVIETSPVDGHTHKLFIDPTTPKWRVPGAAGVEVPIEPPNDLVDEK